MKKTILLSLFALTMLQVNVANASKYEQIMAENIVKIYAANSVEDYQEAINNFDRIAQKETDKWEPLYYSSYGYLMVSMRMATPEEKDKMMDHALAKAKLGLAISPIEDELIALEGFIHMMRVTIDPPTRGQQYSGLSMMALNKAVGIDPNNPRALYLLGQMELGTAQFFGADTTEACAKLQKAVTLFKNQNNENPLAPTWGENQAIGAAEHCSK